MEEREGGGRKGRKEGGGEGKRTEEQEGGREERRGEERRLTELHTVENTQGLICFECFSEEFVYGKPVFSVAFKQYGPVAAE